MPKADSEKVRPGFLQLVQPEKRGALERTEAEVGGGTARQEKPKEEQRKNQGENATVVALSRNGDSKKWEVEVRPKKGRQVRFKGPTFEADK